MLYRNIIFALFLVVQTVLLAQETVFTASAPATVRAGQQFYYTVEGNQKAEAIEPSFDEFDFMGGPSTSFSSRTGWVNGKMTSITSTSYQYLLRAKKEGEFTIPPAKVQIKKNVYKTNPVKVSVAAKPQSSGSGDNVRTSTDDKSQLDPVFLRILPSSKNVYVGEQFVTELKVYTSVDTRPVGGISEVPYEGFYKKTLDADQNANREVISGKQHLTQVLQRHVLIPQKSGDIVIEPFESEWTVPQRVSGGGGFFDDPFFDSYRQVPVKVTTRPVTIHVKSLPEGAPDGFTGGVGSLNFSASLSADNVKVNDAVSLKIVISGTGNIELLGAPEVSFPPDHDVYEPTRKVNVNTRGYKVSGTVTFEYPVVVRHAGNFRIAPVSFSWFDPDEEKYKTAKTKEFLFTVGKAEDNGEEAQIYIPGMRGDEVENIGTDILDINRVYPEFKSVNHSLLGKSIYWLIYALIFIVFVVLMILLPVYYATKADVRLTRNRKANKMARKRLKTADAARKAGQTELFYEETEKAVLGYLGDKLNLELSSLSRENVKTVLDDSGLSSELLDELFLIMDDCEFSRYAPSSEKTDMTKLYQDSLSLLNKLEQNIRVK